MAKEKIYNIHIKTKDREKVLKVMEWIEGNFENLRSIGCINEEDKEMVDIFYSIDFKIR